MDSPPYHNEIDMENFETYEGRKPYMDHRNFDFIKDAPIDAELWLSCGVDDRVAKPKFHIKTKSEMETMPYISIA